MAKNAVTIKKTPFHMKLMMRLLNPLMRLHIRKATQENSTDTYILLHFTGRKTGKHYNIPVMKQDANGRPCVFTQSRWRVNFRGGADIEVTERGARFPMRAELLEDQETIAKEIGQLINKLGTAGATKLGIVIHVDRRPTHEELLDVARRHPLGIIFLAPRVLPPGKRAQS